MTALDVLGGLVLDDGRRWADVAAPFQLDDARAILDPGDGPRLNFDTRPKGGSKSTDVGGVLCAWLVDLAPEAVTAYVFSADLDQSNRLLDRARGLIRRTPGLSSVLKVDARRIVNVRTQARVEALPADVAGSEGLLTPLLILEEVTNWRDTPTARGMLDSALSAIPKWPGCQLVGIGHAGDPGHFSFKLLEQARRSSMWRVNEVPGPLPWVSEADLDEQRALLLPSVFARRHLNTWTAAEDRLTSLDDVRSCVRDGGELEAVAGRRYVTTLDIGLTNDRTVATVGHLEERDAGRVVVVDRQEVWAGSKAKPVELSLVEDWIVEASGAYFGAPLVFDPFQAAHLTQRLRHRGVRVVPFVFSQTSIGRLAVTLFRLLRDHLLDLPDDAALIDELVGVRLIERQPGVYRIDHDAGHHDDRVIGVALAAAHLLERKSGKHAGLKVRGVGEPVPIRYGVLIDPAAEAEKPKRRGMRVRRDDPGPPFGPVTTTVSRG